MFPDLKVQCLYSVVGRLEEYTSSTLSLLPVSLRRQLLLRLPVADLCRLDGDTAVMDGINNEALWREVLRERIKFKRPLMLGELLKKNVTAKDTYLNEVSYCLLTVNYCSTWRHDSPAPKEGDDLSKFKSDVVSFLLYGIPFECDSLSFSSLPLSTSLDVRWAVPLRYAEQAVQVDTLMMVNAFLATCNWYPKIVELTDTYFDQAFHCGDDHTFHSFMSHVDHVQVQMKWYEVNDDPERLRSLWPAILTSNHSPLKEVSLSACVTNLGDLIHVFIDEVFNKPEDRDNQCGDNYNKFTGLKKLELHGNSGGAGLLYDGYTGYLTEELEELIRFLKRQDGLETLIIDGFMNVVENDNPHEPDVKSLVSFDGFEGFYNFLPYVIYKPSFKFLRVERCEVPSNAIESMISVFLSSPTSHAQTLELECCDIVDQSFETHSYDYSLIKPMETPVTCGEFKSLSFLATNSRVPLQWLFQYPGLRLKGLELFYNGSSKQSNLRSFSESLSACPHDSIETLCITFSSIGYGMTAEDVQALSKVFQLCSISELGFIGCGCYGSNEDGLFSILRDTLSQGHLSCLRRFLLSNPSIFRMGQHYDGQMSLELTDSTPPLLAHFRLFFDALFSMPKEQLAKFTLDLSKNMFDPPQQQEIVKAWKANARGQKLKKLIYTPRDAYVQWKGDIPYFSIIFESFPDLAVNVDLGTIL